jgi:hypothetical protein
MLSGNGHACMYYCPSDLVPAWLALNLAYKIFLFYTGNFCCLSFKKNLYCPLVTFLTICPKSVKKIHNYSFVTINHCLDNGNYNSRYLTVHLYILFFHLNWAAGFLPLFFKKTKKISHRPQLPTITPAISIIHRTALRTSHTHSS